MAQTISLFKRNSEKIEQWYDHLIQTIESGINNPDFDSGFTEAFFINPLEIKDYITQQGLEVIKVAGAEGLGNLSEEVLKNLPKNKLAKWIDFTFKYTEDTSLLGSNQHVVCIARKQYISLIPIIAGK